MQAFYTGAILISEQNVELVMDGARRGDRPRGVPYRPQDRHRSPGARGLDDVGEPWPFARSIVADWERGDFSSADWAYPEIEFVSPDGLESRGTWQGVAAMSDRFGDQLKSWDAMRMVPEGYRELDEATVLVLIPVDAQGKRSGIRMRNETAVVFHLDSGVVTRLVAYWDRDRALTDLGLKE